MVSRNSEFSVLRDPRFRRMEKLAHVSWKNYFGTWGEILKKYLRTPENLYNLLVKPAQYPKSSEKAHWSLALQEIREPFI